MATYQFSALADGAHIAFTSSDVLNFDDAGISAISLAFSRENLGGGSAKDLVVMSWDGAVEDKSVVLLDFNLYRVKPTTFTFTNGGKVFVGDGTSGVTSDDLANTRTGTASSDHFIGLGGNDTLNGAGGDDAFVQLLGAGGSYGVDQLNGGTGEDWIAFQPDAAFGVNLNLATGTFSGGDNAGTSGGTLAAIEHADGTNANDTLVGDGGANALFGLDGADSLRGGSGDDALVPGAGNDTVNGGLGADWLDYLDELAGVRVNLATGTATDGAGGSDVLTSIENVDGSAFRDTITGGDGANVLSGWEGNDDIRGGGGDDGVHGGSGADQLRGGSGNDFVKGYAGNDTLWGDAGFDALVGSSSSVQMGTAASTGNDTFVFRSLSEGADSIYAFDVRAANEDRIDFRAVFNGIGYAGTDPLADGRMAFSQFDNGASDGQFSTTIMIDADGAGAGAPVHIATVVGVDQATLTSGFDTFFLIQ